MLNQKPPKDGNVRELEPIYIHTPLYVLIKQINIFFLFGNDWFIYHGLLILPGVLLPPSTFRYTTKYSGDNDTHT